MAFAIRIRRNGYPRPGPAPLMERRPAKQGHPRLRREGHEEGSPDFVPPAERIATFDNDGTLWAEQPMYFQLVFASTA